MASTFSAPTSFALRPPGGERARDRAPWASNRHRPGLSSRPTSTARTRCGRRVHLATSGSGRARRRRPCAAPSRRRKRASPSAAAIRAGRARRVDLKVRCLVFASAAPSLPCKKNLRPARRLLAVRRRTRPTRSRRSTRTVRVFLLASRRNQPPRPARRTALIAPRDHGRLRTRGERRPRSPSMWRRHRRPRGHDQDCRTNRLHLDAPSRERRAL